MWKLPLMARVQMTQIFVYGTLKKGQPNYFEMVDKNNGKAEYCGKAQTVEKYPLVIAGKYNIPFLLNVPGSGQQVRGEIYYVDKQMLQFLDKFEDCPRMYQRTPMKLWVEEWKVGSNLSEVTPTVGSIIEAFAYSTTTYQPEWLNLTCFDSYDAYGDHGLIYTERKKR
ncbi:gamma-glutamylaminecyclotransferase isoform X2 [Lepisosteus oculatus]|uniref:gamma-glutamylaminecyclotransferase isoform X2 n=1 Tax=Lepisosteus oculatus TaxID=7918 RepID=UPI0007403596|nr:PREDICTED: gamma-glutamylaminecyclotransferase isoform X2 [Lepisosteus oculatus]